MFQTEPPWLLCVSAWPKFFGVVWAFPEKEVKVKVATLKYGTVYPTVLRVLRHSVFVKVRYRYPPAVTAWREGITVGPVYLSL